MPEAMFTPCRVAYHVDMKNFPAWYERLFTLQEDWHQKPLRY